MCDDHRINELQAKINALEEEKADKDEVEQLREENQQLREENQQLREQVEQQEERINELEEKHETTHKNVGTLFEETSTIRRKIEEGDMDVPTPDYDPEDPPLQKLVDAPESQLSANERRTAFLWRDLSDYARRTPEGYVITGPELRRVLTAGEPERSDTTIETTTCKRVMKLSRRLSRDVIDIEKKDGVWRMFVPFNWKERSRAVYKDRQDEQEATDSAVS